MANPSDCASTSTSLSFNRNAVVALDSVAFGCLAAGILFLPPVMLKFPIPTLMSSLLRDIEILSRPEAKAKVVCAQRVRTEIENAYSIIVLAGDPSPLLSCSSGAPLHVTVGRVGGEQG